ncbi:zinc finger BED domain-containing protein RICESLEEPER 2-like [Gossypium australe]|uniref:Zinc finger BED domain-containing protein RICESLEEPER 2-like n=1 Tax=Gossypium australe TaxID=47621 RepID=A0A5B6WTD1_9ROSI|nr:zinc finger BED domain-containing protein RICESLEEPER 2-like [Gossypium australe]
MSQPHTTEILVDTWKECIQSWNLDIRFFAITVDNCTTNDVMMDILHGEFPYGSLLLHDQFFYMHYCAYILNIIVQYGLSVVVADGVQRVKDSVVFWTAFDKWIQKFEQNGRVQVTSSQPPSDISNIRDDAYMQEFAQFMEQMILQQIAKDILSILISTVPSEFSFITSGRVLDPYCSQLLPETVEALMCSELVVLLSLVVRLSDRMSWSGELRPLDKFSEGVQDSISVMIVYDFNCNLLVQRFMALYYICVSFAAYCYLFWQLRLQLVCTVDYRIALYGSYASSARIDI